MNQQRMCKNKRSYTDIVTAQGVADRTNRHNNRSHGRKGETVRPYACPFCKHYHIGTGTWRDPNESKS